MACESVDPAQLCRCVDIRHSFQSSHKRFSKNGLRSISAQYRARAVTEAHEGATHDHLLFRENVLNAVERDLGTEALAEAQQRLIV